MTTNIRVFLQRNQTELVFLKQLLDIGNGKVAIDTSTGFITLPSDFCHFTDSKEECIQRISQDKEQQFSNQNWLSEQAILAVKNKDNLMCDDLRHALTALMRSKT